jgi:hypothetical protein
VSTLLALTNYLKNITSISGKCSDTASSSWWSEVTKGDLKFRAVTSPKQSARDMRLIVALRFPASCQNGSDLTHQQSLCSTLLNKIITAKFHVSEFAFQAVYQRLPLALTFGKIYGQICYIISALLGRF